MAEYDSNRSEAQSRRNSAQGSEDQSGAIPDAASSTLSYFTPKFLAGFLAVALYWAWIFSTYFTDILMVSLEGTEAPDLLLKGAGLAGSALFLLVAYRTHGWFSQGTRRIAPKLLPLTCGLAACIPPIVSSVSAFGPWPLPTAVLWLIMGCGTAAALVQLGTLITRIDGDKLPYAVATGTILAGIIYLAVANMQGVATVIAIATLACSTGALLWGAPRLCTSQDNEIVKTRTTGASRAFKQLSLELFFFSVVFGLALCIGVSFSLHNQGQGFVWIALGLPGVFLLLYCTVLNRHIGTATVSRVLLSCIAAILLPLPFLDTFWRIVCCSLLIFGFTCYDMLSFSVLASIIRAESLRPAKYFALGRFANAIGVVIGWIVGSIVLLASDFGDAVFTTACLSCVFLLVVILTFVRWPDYTASRIEDDRKNYWKQSILEIAEKADLSPRETEVLELLSRGRDTEYIHDVLFISSHTVKTHCYHLYKKLDVHSQQEIITLVEAKANEKRLLDKKEPLNG